MLFLLRLCMCLFGVLLLSCSNEKEHELNSVYVHPMLEMPTGFIAGKINEITNMSSEVLINQIYEPLFLYDSELNLKPVLVDSWEISKRNGECIFYIKRGVLFHDSSELTSKDVIYSVNYVSKNLSRNNMFMNNTGTQSVLEECGRYCFKVSSGGVCSQFANVFSGSYFKMVPNDSIRAGVTPPGTGPFRIASWKNDEIKLERFGGYREKSRSNIEQCNFVHMPKDKAIEAYLKGVVDDLLEFSLNKDELTHLKGFKVEMPTYIFNYIGFNLRRPPFDNPKIRVALQYGIDRVGLYRKHFAEQLSINGIVPKGLIGAGAESYYIYSPDVAKKMLKNINTKKQTIEFWIRQQDWNRAFVEDVLQQMMNLGFKVVVKHEKDDVFYEKYFKREQQMFFITLGADYKDADSILSSFSSSSADNDVGIKDRKVDIALSELSSIHDKSDRRDKIREVEKLIMGHAAIIPIYQRIISTLYKESIDGVKLTYSWQEDIRINDYIKKH